MLISLIFWSENIFSLPIQSKNLAPSHYMDLEFVNWRERERTHLIQYTVYVIVIPWVVHLYVEIIHEL